MGYIKFLELIILKDDIKDITFTDEMLTEKGLTVGLIVRNKQLEEFHLPYEDKNTCLQELSDAYFALTGERK